MWVGYVWLERNPKSNEAGGVVSWGDPEGNPEVFR